MPIVNGQDLVKAYGARSVLDGVTVTIRTGERVGLVGNNGSGKSTLARILAGVEQPDTGVVARRRGAEVAYLDQDPRFDEALSAREVVNGGLAAWTEAKARYDEVTYKLAHDPGRDDVLACLDQQTAAQADVERLGGWDVAHDVERILGHVGLADVDAKIGSLSGGELRRVALARILVARPALAVLDEPSNHLDIDTIAWLEEHLADEFPGAVLLITHDRALLDRVVDRTLEIENGKLHAYDGGYEAYLEAKADRLAHEARTESNRQNFLRTELEWLRRQPKARSTKQKARIQRAEAAKGVAAPRAERAAAISLDAVRSGKTILDLRGVTLAPYGAPLVKGLDFTLVAGERVGVVGKNGTGKTTLIKAVLGDLAPTRGEIVVGKNTKVAYFDQHRAELDDDKSIYDNVADNRAKIEIGGQVLDVRGYLERFLFDSHKQRQPVGSLSGGERARAALAKNLSRGANLVILDEPTNDLDVATLGALEQMLVDFDGSALIVTHDRYFLNRVATSVLAFEGDGRVVRYAGGWDDYRAQRARAEEAAAAAKADRASKPPPARAAEPAKPKAVEKGKLTWAEKKELDGILDVIERADADVAALEAKLADPQIYMKGGDVRAMSAELEQKRAAAAKLMARWEDLEARR
jgi:ATP-binding cassette subfamily F protein uup